MNFYELELTANMLEMPAAYEEIDGTTEWAEESDQVTREINRIIQEAYEDHEKLLYERGIAELARREAIIARTYPPYSTNITTLRAEYEEEVKYLKQLLPEEDLDWLDEFSY